MSLEISHSIPYEDGQMMVVLAVWDQVGNEDLGHQHKHMEDGEPSKLTQRALLGENCMVEECSVGTDLDQAVLEGSG